MSVNTFSLQRGDAPLLVSLPHVGIEIPDALKADFVPRALLLEDTDWHLERLYEFAASLGATIVGAVYSRYVIDLNRPPDDSPMYPGAANTELCPTKFFAGDALYLDGKTPLKEEIQRRRSLFWMPYHVALTEELARLRTQHGYVVHWDGHSIRSEIPWLFEGKLPDLNLGTASGTSCDASLREALTETMSAQQAYGFVVDGRFKGGYTTRYYGRPSEGIHTVQMEMTQSTYMPEKYPFAYDEARAMHAQALLQSMLETALTWRPSAT